MPSRACTSERATVLQYVHGAQDDFLHVAGGVAAASCVWTTIVSSSTTVSALRTCVISSSSCFGLALARPTCLLRVRFSSGVGGLSYTNFLSPLSAPGSRPISGFCPSLGGVPRLLRLCGFRSASICWLCALAHSLGSS